DSALRRKVLVGFYMPAQWIGSLCMQLKNWAPDDFVWVIGSAVWRPTARRRELGLGSNRRKQWGQS
ncbi:MAG: hypothetical protein ACKOET_16925, partial [Verrucomicrobiota bacterium]